MRFVRYAAYLAVRSCLRIIVSAAASWVFTKRPEGDTENDFVYPTLEDRMAVVQRRLASSERMLMIMGIMLSFVGVAASVIITVALFMASERSEAVQFPSVAEVYRSTGPVLLSLLIITLVPVWHLARDMRRAHRVNTEQLVRHARQLAQKRDPDPQALADAFNARKELTPFGGRRWTSRTVRRLLRRSARS